MCVAEKATRIVTLAMTAFAIFPGNAKVALPESTVLLTKDVVCGLATKWVDS
jgi:hypothetical protein